MAAPVKAIAMTWICRHCLNANNTNLRTCLRCARQQGDVLPGFLVEGLDARGLVQHLSVRGELHDVLQEAASMYGFDLVLDDEVQHRLRAAVQS